MRNTCNISLARDKLNVLMLNAHVLPSITIFPRFIVENILRWKFILILCMCEFGKMLVVINFNGVFFLRKNLLSIEEIGICNFEELIK